MIEYYKSTVCEEICSQGGEDVAKQKTIRGLCIKISERKLSVIVFSLFFSWLLAFPFEGRILYALADYYSISAHSFVFGAMVAHFAGLLVCGFFVKNMKTAKLLMLFSIAFCIAASAVFFAPPSFLWTAALISSAFLVGCCVAAWGFYFKGCTPKNERIKTIADGLIFSNILMIVLNMAATHISPHAGLGFSMLMLGAAFLFALQLPKKEMKDTPSSVQGKVYVSKAGPLAFLCLFIVVITINSGLMYQVINPAFEHLTELTSWYWAVPYIVALVVMRSLPRRISRAVFLYVGMAMIMSSFISFMLLKRGAIDYLIVDTLMLGACGIFDLFWWSILGEMLEYTDNPAKLLGIGLSANVLGVLCGGAIGMVIAAAGISGAELTVISLLVVCVTLTLLPPLSRRLSLLLKNHAYLAVYSKMDERQQKTVVSHVKTLDPLTEREKDVLAELLSGKSNKEIAEALFISESTVKTHVRSIFSKYDVSSRAELISTLLKNQSEE